MKTLRLRRYILILKAQDRYSRRGIAPVDAPAPYQIQLNLNTLTNPERPFTHMINSLLPRLTAPLDRIRRALSSSRSRAPVLAQSDYDQMRRVMLK